MHDGSLATLEDVVEYYDCGGNRNPGLDGELHPLHLTPAEKRSIVEFLGCLNGLVQRYSAGRHYFLGGSSPLL